VLDELPDMLQAYEFNFVTKIIYIFRINQQISCTTQSVGSQSVKSSLFLSNFEVFVQQCNSIKDMFAK